MGRSKNKTWLGRLFTQNQHKIKWFKEITTCHIKSIAIHIYVECRYMKAILNYKSYLCWWCNAAPNSVLSAIVLHISAVKLGHRTGQSTLCDQFQLKIMLTLQFFFLHFSDISNFVAILFFAHKCNKTERHTRLLSDLALKCSTVFPGKRFVTLFKLAPTCRVPAALYGSTITFPPFNSQSSYILQLLPLSSSVFMLEMKSLCYWDKANWPIWGDYFGLYVGLAVGRWD